MDRAWRATLPIDLEENRTRLEATKHAHALFLGGSQSSSLTDQPSKFVTPAVADSSRAGLLLVCAKAARGLF